MFGSVVLEVALGVILTFSFFSIIMTSVREGIEALLKTRAKLLEKTIKEMLGRDPDALSAFYKNPAINALFLGDYVAKGRNLPSYIPAANFAAAMIDLVKVPESLPQPVQSALAPFIAGANEEADAVRSRLEAWFNSAMDRVSGSYKRQSQLWFIVLGFLAAAVMNINPLLIGNRLASDQQLRADVVAFAPHMNQTGTLDPDAVNAITGQFKAVGLPIGWSSDCKPADIFVFSTPDQNSCYNKGDGLLKSLGGWLIAAFAAMLGAPFWFDLLNRIVNLRASLKPTEPDC